MTCLPAPAGCARSALHAIPIRGALTARWLCPERPLPSGLLGLSPEAGAKTERPFARALWSRSVRLIRVTGFGRADARFVADLPADSGDVGDASSRCLRHRFHRRSGRSRQDRRFRRGRFPAAHRGWRRPALPPTVNFDLGDGVELFCPCVLPGRWCTHLLPSLPRADRKPALLPLASSCGLQPRADADSSPAIVVFVEDACICTRRGRCHG
jgi:hypothetical protein